MRGPQNYFAPDAADPAYLDVTQFLHFRDTAQSIGEFWSSSICFLGKAEGLTQHGGASPDALVAPSRLQHASLVLVGARGNLATFEIAQHIRRFFGLLAGIRGKDAFLVGGGGGTYRFFQIWALVNRAWPSGEQKLKGAPVRKRGRATVVSCVSPPTFPLSGTWRY